MYNLINGKTLNQVVAEQGLVRGLTQFQTHCTGKTFAEALRAISDAMVSATAVREGVVIVQCDVFVHAQRIAKLLGLVGFSFKQDVGKITYYPFGGVTND
ncbi:hypothetical protein PhiM1_17 [Pectobacterium phage PhiM1]|uniref:Uncharacterized protein n=1 Tax=Pectobacterium phage PhiM1 TaxID=1211386 RepID=A0A1P7WFZ8_9CAUD|nr:hypothetical protein FDG64_gp17 [Pectobacterium phage PhiM1]AFQ22502.1 hypothetical protein PhiM1_17 [Pectobacterium phage PhiM1]